jgi:hypothetical protein
MTNDERMQRESSVIATIRKKLPEFAKACADDTDLCCSTKTRLPPAKRMNSRARIRSRLFAPRPASSRDVRQD